MLHMPQWFIFTKLKLETKRSKLMSDDLMAESNTKVYSLPH